MLNRSQVYTLLMLRDREDSVFSGLPNDVIRAISDVGCESDSDITKALHHAAVAEKENIDALKRMLDGNPRLLLEAGNIITPNGLDVRRVTLYEFSLGAGDVELAELIASCFSKIPDGEKERSEQYERYRLAIEEMRNQTPYDLTLLIDVIKKSSFEDVNAELHHVEEYNSELREALNKFRQDMMPGILKKARMHYNYANLKHAFDVFQEIYYEVVGNDVMNYDKLRIIWKQIIGFLIRDLPSCDKQAFSRGLINIVKNKAKLERSFKPIDSVDDKLGLDFSIEMDGARSGSAEDKYDPGFPARKVSRGMLFDDHIREKEISLNKLSGPALPRLRSK